MFSIALSLVGISYIDFIEKIPNADGKEYYSSENKLDFSTFSREAEFQFIDNTLSSIKIRDLSVSSELYDFDTSMRLEKCLSMLSRHDINWGVYSRYSSDEYIVIKAFSEVLLEYEFNGEYGWFVLQTIRIN